MTDTDDEAQTLARVVTRTAELLDELGHETRTAALEARAAQADTRAALAEFRTSLAEQRIALVEFRAEVTRRFDTLFGALADLRTEYAQHTHPEQ